MSEKNIELTLEQRIENLLESSFDNLGIDIVSVSMQKLGKNNVLQILIDKKDGSSVGIDDCIECNKVASALLDVDNAIDVRYNLEISSPGENRPLKKPKDFERFLGNPVKVELRSVINNRKRFKGVIFSVKKSDSGEDAEIMFSDLENENKNDSRDIAVMFGDIKKATVKKVFKIK